MQSCVVVAVKKSKQKHDNVSKNYAHVLTSRLHQQKNYFLSNIMILVPLKQEQVEVPTTDYPADFTDSILLHRSVVEDLNDTIRVSDSPPPL